MNTQIENWQRILIENSDPYPDDSFSQEIIKFLGRDCRGLLRNSTKMQRKIIEIAQTGDFDEARIGGKGSPAFRKLIKLIKADQEYIRMRDWCIAHKKLD